tara:strand:- start:1141 stop:1446 length:306 start_codon:yes stop_codon:yes gene_type:complete
MTGPCLCGDIYCPNCGNPGQADFEMVTEYIYEALLADLHESQNREWWAEEIANRFAQNKTLVDALFLAASKWARDQEQKRRDQSTKSILGLLRKNPEKENV